MKNSLSCRHTVHTIHAIERRQREIGFFILKNIYKLYQWERRYAATLVRKKVRNGK